MQNCENCKFWKRYGPSEEIKGGFCLRYPPRQLMSEYGDPFDKWAETDHDDWCGEFKKKSDAKAERKAG